MTAPHSAAWPTGLTLIDLLNDEHRDLTTLVARLHPYDPQPQLRTSLELVTRFARYRRLSIDHVDPLLRRFVPHGLQRADDHLGELAGVELLASQIRRDGLSHPPSDALIQALRNGLSAHLGAQWHTVIPLLNEHVPVDVLTQRGQLAACRRAPGPVDRVGQER